MSDLINVYSEALGSASDNSAVKRLIKITL